MLVFFPIKGPVIYYQGGGGEGTNFFVIELGGANVFSIGLDGVQSKADMRRETYENVPSPTPASNK